MFLGLALYAALNTIVERDPSSLVDAMMTSHKDKELAQWKEDPKTVQRPKPELLNAQMKLEGKWLSGGRMDFSLIEVAEAPDGYSVKFATGGCMARWKLNRTASFRNGVVSLNMAVDPYFGAPYKTLYAVHMNDTDYLIPAWCVKEAETAADVVLSLYTFRRIVDDAKP